MRKNENHSNVKFLKVILIVLLVMVNACSKNDNEIKERPKLIPPTELKLSVLQDENKAFITGKSSANVNVYLKYAKENGAVFKSIKSDNQGFFRFQVELLTGYAQDFVVYSNLETNNENYTSDIVEVDRVPKKKEALNITIAEIKAQLISRRWKSDQIASRIMIKQTVATPPYDMFVTTAQKYFGFNNDNTFYFTVTNPLQFTDTKGSWSIDENLVITINTYIPLGPMKMKNIYIQELSEEKFVFVTTISDGIFLITLVGE